MQEDDMPNDSSPNFEIPPHMREMAEKSVEQAKQAFDSFIAVAQHAVTTAENQAVNARAGAKDVSEAAMQFAERNIASSFDFAQKLLRARDAQEVMGLHSEYVKNQITVMTDQAKDLSRRAASMAKPQAH
jgi:phasin